MLAFGASERGVFGYGRWRPLMVRTELERQLYTQEMIHRVSSLLKRCLHKQQLLQNELVR
jgi:hypothetical protein